MYKSSSLASMSQNGNTIRQAPHYYKPYFGYLSSFIMSYAVHVVLISKLVHSTLSHLLVYHYLLLSCLVPVEVEHEKGTHSRLSRMLHLDN
jgi:hypothetical protein